MMPELTEAQVYRNAADVQRYHVMRTIRTQTVGQHTFNMLMLIKQATEGQGYLPTDMLELYHRVMHHDLPELYTGDIPGPIKRAHPSLGPLLDEIEEDLQPVFRPDLGDLDPELAVLLKWADRVEGAMWAMEELRMGNTYLRKTVERYLGWLINARIPDCASELTTALVFAAFEEFNITPATGATLEQRA
jgi:5'-deoxynucleotidase YfbR-like HD superfamily hydrolase